MDPLTTGMATLLSGAAVEIALDRGATSLVARFLRDDDDLRMAMHRAREVYGELTRNVRYLRHTRYQSMTSAEDERDLVEVARGLQVDHLRTFTGRTSVVCQLSAFLDTLPIPETTITMLRILRRVAERGVSTRDGAEAMARAPRHATSLRLVRRLQSLHDEMEELRLYFREFPGIKPGTSLGPRASLWRRLSDKFWRRTSRPPITLPLVEGRRRREAMLVRQRQVVALLPPALSAPAPDTHLGGGRRSR